MEMASLSKTQLSSFNYYFAIDGCDELVSKDVLWQILVNAYGKQYVSNAIMPMTYLLHLDTDKETFLSENDGRRAFILKKNIQRKEGLFLSNDEKLLSKKIQEREFVVAQLYLRDTFRVENHKLNVRLYVFAVRPAKASKTSFYIHREGKCIYTSLPHIQGDLSSDRNITSLNMNVEIYKRLPQSVKELLIYIRKMRSVQEAETIWSKTVDILKSATKPFCKRMGLSKQFYSIHRFQLFGVDIIYRDKDLKPFLLEFNKGPDMSAANEKDFEMKTGVMRDCLNFMNSFNIRETNFIPLS